MRSALPVVAMMTVLAVAPGRALAADKTHQQIMAEIRMLQEQQQQLQQMMGGLAETLKMLAVKIDEQTGANRKGFADQKLVIDNVAEGVRILRQKADDTNVRLSSMTQELDAVRQTIAALPRDAAPPAVDPVTGAPIPAPEGTSQTPASGGPINVSHERVYEMSYADYTGGQYDLAITGFEAYIKQFPTSPLADEAQLNIGNSYYGAGRFQEAVTALQKVISDYPEADSVSPAYYKLGQSYERLNQPDLARKAYETLMQRFPNSPENFLAKQALDRMSRKGAEP